MHYLIEPVTSSSQSAVLQFLKQQEDYTLFLLGNIQDYGLKISDKPYSGNFKLIRSAGKIVGVFSLTKSGTLLIEATVPESAFAQILAACREESIPLHGLIGRWDFCRMFWDFLKNQNVIRQEISISKEKLYSLDLSEVSFSTQSNIRLLTQNDYVQWKPMRLDFLKEEGLPNALTDAQILEQFQEKVRTKIIWGFFLKDQLVSTADLNAKALDLGQVGGVYTAPHFRQRGYSRAVLQQLIVDAKQLHALRKLVIFTRENNFPARKLYESLGVSHVGYFALFFGN